MEIFFNILLENVFVNENYTANSSFTDEYAIIEETMIFKDKYKEPLLKQIALAVSKTVIET